MGTSIFSTADVEKATGRSVTVEDLVRAVGIVGTYINRDIEEEWYSTLSVADQRRLRNAIAWQSLVPESNYPIGVSSISSGDQSISFNDDTVQYLHPLALKCIEGLSWRRCRTTFTTRRPGDPGKIWTQENAFMNPVIYPDRTWLS